MQNIDLSALKKKQFTINGDENCILELNTSDVNIAVRLKENYPNIAEYLKEFDDLKAADDELTDETLALLSDKLKDVDNKLRDTIDKIFDSNVCEVCCPNISLFTIINGKFAYEYIIDALSALYEKDLQTEFKKVETRIKKHTDKYTKRK